MPETLNKINNLIVNLRSTEYKDMHLRNKVTEQIKIINEKIQPRQNELTNLINRIVDKEGRVAKKLSVVNVDDINSLNAINNSFNSFDDRSSSEFVTTGFREYIVYFI